LKNAADPGPSKGCGGFSLEAKYLKMTSVFREEEFWSEMTGSLRAKVLLIFKNLNGRVSFWLEALRAERLAGCFFKKQ
jgi:hypothetical protein